MLPLAHNANLNAYTMEMTLNISIVTNFTDSEMTISANGFGDGATDRQARKTFMKVKVGSAALGQGETVIDSYVVDNYLYTKTMGFWEKKKLNRQIREFNPKALIHS